MNRDKVISIILVLLLILSLVFNWVLWRKSRGAASPAVAATPAAQAAARKSPPRERGTQGLYDITANPEMKGRLGRIVVTFAEGVDIRMTRTSFYKAGSADSIKSDYGKVATELPPGTYDLEVSGKKIAGIPVESGKDTGVRSGVLRLHGSKETRFSIYDVGAKNFLHVAYGNAELGLPVGEYEVEISEQREKVKIESGKVTDF